MYLPVVPCCKASVTLLVKTQKNRVEEEYPSHATVDKGVQMTTYHRPIQKDCNKSYYTDAIKANELNDLLGHCHRADGGIHMQVDDVSKLDG